MIKRTVLEFSAILFVNLKTTFRMFLETGLITRSDDIASLLRSNILAMVAIRLNTTVQAFIKAGPRAVLLGAATWSAVALSSLAVQLFTQVW